MTNTNPRPSPYKLGTFAARRGDGLRGMPFGPGQRQDDYIRGYQTETTRLAHQPQRKEAA